MPTTDQLHTYMHTLTHIYMYLYKCCPQWTARQLDDTKQSTGWPTFQYFVFSGAHYLCSDWQLLEQSVACWGFAAKWLHALFKLYMRAHLHIHMCIVFECISVCTYMRVYGYRFVNMFVCSLLLRAMPAKFISKQILMQMLAQMSNKFSKSFIFMLAVKA